MDKNTALSTSSLFHYTKKDSLFKILESRCFKPNFSPEKFFLYNEEEGATDLFDEVYIAMICFCDIPLNLVGNHIEIYDKYAIGLTKEWGCSIGVSPVIYYPSNGGTKSIIKHLIHSYHSDYINIKTIQEKKYGENIFDKEGILLIEIMKTYNRILDLIFYTKPYQGEFTKNDILYHDYKFYDEREWRFIPINILSKNYVNKKEADAPGFEFPILYPLSFEVNDITDILVPLNELEHIKKTISKIPEMACFDLSKIKSFEV